MSRRTFNLALGAIIALALAVRIFAAFEVNSIVPQSDAADFDRHALSITAGRGYPEALPVLGGPGPSAFRPPLYPVVLSAVYLVTDTTDESERWLAARLEQALIGTLVVALIGLIAFQLWGRRPALIAAGIAARLPADGSRGHLAADGAAVHGARARRDRGAVALTGSRRAPALDCGGRPLRRASPH